MKISHYCNILLILGFISGVYCFVLGFISGVTAVRTGSTEAVLESPSRRRINSTPTSVRTVRRVATAWSPPNSSPTGGAPSSNDSSINYRYSIIPRHTPAHHGYNVTYINSHGLQICLHVTFFKPVSAIATIEGFTSSSTIY